MKNKFLMTTAVVALSTAASLASAQSISSGGELWTGGFVGIGGSFLDVSGDINFYGYTEGDSDSMGYFHTFGEGYGEGVAVGSDAFGTIEVGADKQLNQLVFGGFASYDFGNVDAIASNDINVWDAHDCGGYCEGPASNIGMISVGNNWTIGGRAGYLATPNTLVYGLLGFSSASMSVAGGNILEGFFEGEGDLTVVNRSEVMDVSGNTFGVGVEHLIKNNWSVKLEYRSTTYDGSALSVIGSTDFEGDDYDGFVSGDAGGVGDITTQSIRTSVSYRF